MGVIKSVVLGTLVHRQVGVAPSPGESRFSLFFLSVPQSLCLAVDVDAPRVSLSHVLTCVRVSRAMRP